MGGGALGGGALGGVRAGRRARDEAAGELPMFAHPVALAPSVDDVTVVQEPVDQRRRHDLVDEDLAPVLEGLDGPPAASPVLSRPAHG